MGRVLAVVDVIVMPHIKGTIHLVGGHAHSQSVALNALQVGLSFSALLLGDNGALRLLPPHAVDEVALPKASCSRRNG